MIDWLSYTGPAPHGRASVVRDCIETARQDTGAFFDSYKAQGRAPYRQGAVCEVTHTVLAAGGHDTYLIELSGRACASLRQRQGEEALTALAISKLSSVTRIDLAIDLGDVDPGKIAAESLEYRNRAHSLISSPTGETAYLGSFKSANLCRVYRYTQPSHPRYGRTRIEVQMRRQYARRAIAMIAKNGLKGAIGAVFATYGLGHYVGTENAPMPPLARLSPDGQRTLAWLQGPVRASIWRLVKDEGIDIWELLETLATNPDE